MKRQQRKQQAASSNSSTSNTSSNTGSNTTDTSETVEIQGSMEQFQAVFTRPLRDIQLYLQDMDIEVLNFIRVLIFRHQQEPLLLQQVQVQ
ncbi:MAG: hypothetical protein ACLRR3_01635 [Eubacterium sp.]